MADTDLLDNRQFDLGRVAARIRAVREKHALTQQECADRLGYSRRQFINWENGDATPPIWALAAIRREFDVDPEWVLSGPGDVPLREAIPPEIGRKERLVREVESLVNDVGITLPPAAIDNLADLIAREAPDAEAEAKRRTRQMLRAIVMGNRK